MWIKWPWRKSGGLRQPDKELEKEYPRTHSGTYRGRKLADLSRRGIIPWRRRRPD